MARLDSSPTIKPHKAADKSTQLFTTRRTLVAEERTPLASLFALREAWLQDDLERHVAMSGQLLGQLARRPWFAASVMLDATVLVAERVGMDGIVPVALTCLSAAHTLAPSQASKAADTFVLALMDRKLKLQPNGIHLFLDLEQMAQAAISNLVADLIVKGTESKRPSLIEGKGDPLDDARLGGVEGMIASLNKKGAFLPPALLAALAGSKPHDELMNIVKYKPNSSQALPGFGPMTRQAAQGDPWFQWKEPGVGHVSAGTDPKMTPSEYVKAMAAKGKGPTMVITAKNNPVTQQTEVQVHHVDKQGNATPPIPDDPDTGRYIYPTDTNGNVAAGPPKPSDPKSTAKTPLPDDVGGDDFPEVLGQFAATGLQPWTMPVENATGAGPAVLHIPAPSAINPGSEAPSTAPVTPAEVEKMLQFIQATKFNALVNPIPFKLGSI